MSLHSPSPGPPHADVGGWTTERVSSLEELRDEWVRLADQCGSPFATWEWASAWWKAFGDERQLLLHVVKRSDGTVAAILPLYLAWRRGPVRVVRFIGHGVADQLAPVCAPHDRAATAAALRRLVPALVGPAGIVLAERLPAHEEWRALLGGRLLREEPTPRLVIDGQTWDDWLKSKSRNFREQVRRRERKLAREHDVETELVVDPNAVIAAFESLVELHDARWRGTSRSFTDRRLAFHRDFLLRAADRGWARIWLLRVDGRPAAAWYGFRFGDADWYYQSGRSPDMDSANVGFVLLCHTLSDAFSAGRQEYRFLLGDEPYKDRFMSDDPGIDTIALAGAPVALAAKVAARVASSTPTIRRVVSRAVSST